MIGVVAISLEPKMPNSLEFHIPIRLQLGGNVRGARGRTSRIRSEERYAARVALGRHNNLQAVLRSHAQGQVIRVTMTRQGPTNGLDDDNLTFSCKGIRDEIAAWLGVDDRTPLVTWRSAQERLPSWQVLVRIDW